MSLTNGFGCRNPFVVIHPDVPPEELDTLAHSAPTYVLVRVASHARTARSTLGYLAKHPDTDVRCAVGENPNTPEHVVAQLACDPDPDVRYSMAENHNLCLPVLRKLSLDDNPYVAQRAARTLERLGQQGQVVVCLDIARIAACV